MKQFQKLEPKGGHIIKGKPYKSESDSFSSIPLVDAMDVSSVLKMDYKNLILTGFLLVLFYEDMSF